MARGVREFLDVDYGLSVTGIAGPGGGSPEKPVGLVYMAVADASGASVERHQFGGNREAIKSRSAHAALYLLWRRLRERSA
jgi:nicotinamide-nucleotide amidase